jgi:uncharacterized protein
MSAATADEKCTKPHGAALIDEFIVKVASRCNLNCTYCYMYNKGDDSWMGRPRIMSDIVFCATLINIAEHCRHFGLGGVSIMFHGGEPTLVGVDRFDRWCRMARDTLGGLEVKLSIQTNGTLLDSSWARLLATHNVGVGISMDGPAELHDIARVDHRRRGSHADVLEGIAALNAVGVPFGLLCVTPLGIPDPVAVHRHFVDVGAASVGYLFPDHTHDTIGEIRDRYGAHPVADFLIPIFDDWWSHGNIELRVSPFWEMARAIRGGDSGSDLFQNSPLHYVVVETDGEIQGLDVLRICDGLGRTGMNVATHQFRDALVAETDQISLLRGSTPLAELCLRCDERQTCGGGHLPHRYSRDAGFDNPSVWCTDLLLLFGHIRARMGVTQTQTQALRTSREQQMLSPS